MAPTKRGQGGAVKKRRARRMAGSIPAPHPDMKHPATWSELNIVLRDCTEAQAEELLATEMGDKSRAQWLLRISARIRKLRGRREREELNRVGVQR